MNDSEKGICRLSLVPMRDKAAHDGLLTSQLLFGEHYTVLEKNSDWVFVKLHFDETTGWIPMDQHDVITNEYFDQINLSDYKVCTDVTGSIFFKKKYVSILLGSILPISTNELFKLEEQVAYNGASKSLNQKRDAEFLKEVASGYVHAPYLPGGKSPFGIDPGGFIQQVFKICGYNLKRTLEAQVTQGSAVDSIDVLEYGDVVFTGADTVSNAFIYLPDQKFFGLHNGRIQTITDKDELGTIRGIRRVLYTN